MKLVALPRSLPGFRVRKIVKRRKRVNRVKRRKRVAAKKRRGRPRRKRRS